MRTQVVLIIGLILLSILFVEGCLKWRGKLTDDDFKILSASWDVYTDSEEIDWQELCDSCRSYKKYCLPEWEESGYCKAKDIEKYLCYLNMWHLEVYATEMLKCNAKVDGILYNETTIIFKGQRTTRVPWGERLDFRKDHEIIICCESDEINGKIGEICKSIVLPHKCT
jgi:hypothetical protein